MLRRIVLGFAVGIVALLPLKSESDTRTFAAHFQPTYSINDKMLILHKGREMCVDWWSWEGHRVQHGDTLLGSCDVPETDD